jgi:AraC-like DNA-binding protein
LGFFEEELRSHPHRYSKSLSFDFATIDSGFTTALALRIRPMPSPAPLPSFFYPPVDEGLLKIGFYLTTIGAHTYANEAAYPLGDHPEAYRFTWEKGRIFHDFALILIEQGTGRFESSSVPLTPVKAGHAIWLVPGEWHRYRPDSPSGWTEKWIGLNGFHLHQLRKSDVIPNRSALLTGHSAGQRESTVAMQESLLNEVRAAPTRNSAVWSTRALGIVLNFFEDTPAMKVGRMQPPTEDALVNLALSYIRENCHRPISVSWTAARCQSGRRALERHFSAAGRQSIAKEIVAARIERAEFLLRESPLPIKEIAYSCGFTNPQRMIYSFRQHFGCTPGSLRKSGSDTLRRRD